MRRPDAEDGSAVLELVALSVVVLLPVVWAIVAVVRAEAVSFATREASRDAARAFVTGSSVADGRERAETAARLAYSSQGLDVQPTVTLHEGSTCSGRTAAAPLQPGTDITACLSVDVPLPLAERLGGVVHLKASHTFRLDEHRSTLR